MKLYRKKKFLRILLWTLGVQLWRPKKIFRLGPDLFGLKSQEDWNIVQSFKQSVPSKSCQAKYVAVLTPTVWANFPAKIE